MISFFYVFANTEGVARPSGLSQQLHIHETLRDTSPLILVLLTKALQRFLVEDSGTSELVVQGRKRRSEEVVTTSLVHPAVQLHAGFGGSLAIGQTNGTLGVVLKSLTDNGIDTRSVITDEVGLAVGEVVVASPA